MQTQAERVETELASHIDDESFALVRMGKQWEYWGHAYRDVWTADTENFVEHHPGYRAIAWVDPELRAQWVAPPHGNEWLEENDLSANAQIAASLRTASHRLEVTTTDAQLLPDGKHALVVCVPISKDDGLAGYIMGIIDSQRILDRTVERRFPSGYSVSVTTEGESIYNHVADGSPLGDDWRHSSKLDIRGVAWRLELMPHADRLNQAESALPMAILVSGTLVALLLALSVHLVQKAGLRARQLKVFNATLEQRVADRTSELARAKNAADSAR